LRIAFLLVVTGRRGAIIRRLAGDERMDNRPALCHSRPEGRKRDFGKAGMAAAAGSGKTR